MVASQFSWNTLYVELSNKLNIEKNCISSNKLISFSIDWRIRGRRGGRRRRRKIRRGKGGWGRRGKGEWGRRGKGGGWRGRRRKGRRRKRGGGGKRFG